MWLWDRRPLWCCTLCQDSSSGAEISAVQNCKSPSGGDLSKMKSLAVTPILLEAHPEGPRHEIKGATEMRGSSREALWGGLRLEVLMQCLTCLYVVMQDVSTAPRTTELLAEWRKALSFFPLKSVLHFLAEAWLWASLLQAELDLSGYSRSRCRSSEGCNRAERYSCFASKNTFVNILPRGQQLIPVLRKGCLSETKSQVPFGEQIPSCPSARPTPALTAKRTPRPTAVLSLTSVGHNQGLGVDAMICC
ncbi:uncharacterized protein O9250_000996 [Rhynochetos jubatus]